MSTRKGVFESFKETGKLEKTPLFPAKIHSLRHSACQSSFFVRTTVKMTSLCRRVLNHVALDVQDDRAADGETVSATVDVTARGT